MDKKDNNYNGLKVDFSKPINKSEDMTKEMQEELAEYREMQRQEEFEKLQSIPSYDELSEDDIAQLSKDLGLSHDAILNAAYDKMLQEKDNDISQNRSLPNAPTGLDKVEGHSITGD